MIRRITLSLFAGFLSINISYGQNTGFNPYEVNLNQELILVSTGVALNITAILAKAAKAPLTEQMLLTDTSTERIPGIDQSALDNFDEEFLEASNTMLYVSLALPLLNLIDRNMSDRAGTVMMIYFETLVMTTGVWGATTGIISRRRPVTYNESVPLDVRTNKSARDSFFSGHTSISASASFCGAKLFADFHPDSKLKPVVWTVAAALPAFIGFARVQAGKHFPTDVVTGYVVGASIGYVIPELHRIGKSDSFTLLPAYDGGGFALTYTF